MPKKRYTCEVLETRKVLVLYEVESENEDEALEDVLAANVIYMEVLDDCISTVEADPVPGTLQCIDDCELDDCEIERVDDPKVRQDDYDDQDDWDGIYDTYADIDTDTN